MKRGTYTLTSRFGPRWGTHHSGLDFGAPDGTPIYACAGGKVIHIGPASGYGQWIVLDHPDSEGGGCTEYGHMWNAFATGLKAGDWVDAGQLIGYVGSNGQSTGPHLHLTVWEHGYGGRRIDPEAWLKTAPHPGETPKEAPKMILGIDISEHQDGMPLSAAKAQGVEFVIIRLCDGTYRDKTFTSHLDDAEQQGLLVSTYWYLRAPSEGTTIAQQVDVIDAQMGGRRDLGVWIDVESVARNGRKLLTGDDVWAAKRELEARGYYVPGIYSGAWYWEKMPGGEPSMDGLGHLWVSHYGRNLRGIPRDLYAGDGGDGHAGWSYPLGDRLPDILQFGSQGAVAGKLVDVNAYRGSLDELRAIFTGGDAPSPAPEPEKEVPVINLESVVRGYAGGGLEGPLWTFLLHADRNSFDAMHAALRNEERLTRIEEKLDRLLAKE
ncbi:peptidoglycan DD-metalloendopeptidase family protein [Corynebacterium hansenii]|uniref:Peptidoglycan DD-metalloendopeptidase family protein n=1 Tax=Corynebacterium hansenii TaxID=394964 RepID=A0ABV7ZNE6_9CORY|nr:peptidoglycan DD-metalloendopeptidase family protein [Corynebacterium hansenii]